MLTPTTKLAIEQVVLCWLATTSLDGQPNVSPKEVFTHFADDSVVIANIASPGSARNIRDSPLVCVSLIDIFSQKGFKIRGPAAVLRAGDEDFAEIEAKLTEITRGEYPFASVFRVWACEVSEIIAPSYILKPEITDAERVQAAMRNYGVRPV